MAEHYFLGIDVGTGSVRAALVRRNGSIVKTSTSPIKTWNPQRDFYEQSSDDIWKSCSDAIKAVSNSIDPNLIKGIGFDATCSLVCIGPDDRPLTVSLTGNSEQNIILWMDHRSNSEAEFINECRPEVLKYVGGKISPEMQTPKLMWLKRNLKETWNRAKYFFDLVDFLTWKATGDDSRSLCTVVCKWTYLVGVKDKCGWDQNYFSLIDLNDLLYDNAVKIGNKVKIPGEKCGSGLTEAAARDLGLLPGTCVAAGLIDAHAGGLGLLTASAPGLNPSFETKIGLICGTSTCHMVVSQSSKMIPGIWGPYFNAMIPNMYLNEAGQSATGKLIDFIIETHPAFPQLKNKLKNKTQIHEYLNEILNEMTAARKLPSLARLTSQIHVWPDFHGNRAPLADPSLLGMISGLNLAADETDLALKYLATIQALAYGTRHILETLRLHGHDQLSTVLMCGGLSKNKLFAQTHADVLGMSVLLPETPEPVLLGAAILGSVAAGEWKDVVETIKNMSGPSNVFIPSKIDREYHFKKYEVFLKMVKDQKSYEAIMRSEVTEKE